MIFPGEIDLSLTSYHGVDDFVMVESKDLENLDDDKVETTEKAQSLEISNNQVSKDANYTSEKDTITLDGENSLADSNRYEVYSFIQSRLAIQKFSNTYKLIFFKSQSPKSCMHV